MQNTTRTRALSLLLTVFLLISAFGVFPVSAEASAAVEPLIIDMSSQAAAEKTLKFSPSPESGLTGTNKDWGTNAGYYLFDETEEALVLKKSTLKTATSYWRYLLVTDGKADAEYKLAETQKYMVLVYKTNYNGDSAAAINLNRFSNSAADQLLIEDDVRVSGGKWVRTDAVNINNLGTNDANDLFYRLYQYNNHDTVVVMFPDDASSDVCLYIKEVAFFESPEQADAYYLANPIKNPTDVILSVNAPETVVAGATFDADIVASTKLTAAQELSSVNFSLTYGTELTLNSITPASGIGGEGLSVGNDYGWYYDGENGISLTSDAPSVIAKANFTAKSDVTEPISAEIGFDTQKNLNVALADDILKLGFTPDTVKGSTTVKAPTVKLTVPEGLTVCVNDGTPVVGGADVTVDIKVGDKVTLTSNDGEVIVKSLSYKIGDGDAVALTQVNGVYTLPTATLDGDITLEYTTYDYYFIEADEYMALAADQKIFVLPTTTAGVNDTTYTLGGTYNKSLYYSSRYDAYVAIVGADEAAGAIGSVLTYVVEPAEAISYSGDINLDGNNTAGDAALISGLLHSYSNGSKADDSPAVTDLMRLSADVVGKYSVGGSYVSVVDAIWTLYKSVGLTFDAPDEEVKIEGIIIPTTTYAEANKGLDIYTIDTFTTDYANKFGSNVGKYEFDPLEGAFSLKHASNTYMGSNFKFHLILDSSVSTTITDESWIVVTYRTNYNGAEKASIKLASNEFSEDVVVLADDISVSGGEYVFSTPTNIDVSDVTKNLFGRLKTRTHSAFTVTMPDTTDDSEIYFYIKEIAFFESEKMAKAYIATTELPEANTDTYSRFTLYNLEEALEDMQILNNNYIKNGTSHTFIEQQGEGQVGEYRFHEEQQALEILKSAKIAGGDYHRFYFVTKSGNMVRENEEYMVILYRTNIEAPGKIRFNNNGFPNIVTLAEDMSVSSDKWVFSTPVNINVGVDPDTTRNNPNLFGRVRRGTLTPIFFDIPIESESTYDAEQYFFLKEVLFFSSKEAAERYTSNAVVPEATVVTFGNGLSKDMWIDPVAVSLESAEKSALNASVIGIEYTSDGAKLQDSASVQFKSEGYLYDNHVMVALSYKTTSAGTITLGDTVMASDTSVSAGEWVYTDAVALIDEVKAAFVSGTPNTITYTGDGDLYVGELVFISNTMQLEAYESEFEAAAVGTYYDGKLGEFNEITVLDGEGFGEWSYSPETATVLQNTSEKYDSSYRLTYKFINRDEILDKGINVKPLNDRELVYFFMRVAYKADNGSGEGVQLVTLNPESGITTVLDDVENTNGEWVISDPVRLPTDLLEALSGHGEYYVEDYEELHHKPAVLAFTNTASDAEYAVKNIYFFKTAEDAISFTLPEDEAAPVSSYTVGGTKLDRVTPVSAVDTALAADAYKIYVDGTDLKVLAGSDEVLVIANKVAEMRVLGGDTYLDVVDITLAADFVLNGTAPAGEPSETFALKYDDRYTFDKTVAYVGSVGIISTDAITGEADVSVLKRITGETFAASAVGEATVVFTDGTSVKVTVSAAPLNVILLGGQSNTEGVSGSVTTSIRNVPGQVYSTYAPAGYRYISWMLGADFANNIGTDALTVYNSDVFIPKSLTTNVSHANSTVGYELDFLNEGGHGKGGIDSAIAYEWNRQTGEKVWVINAAHSGSRIASWQPGTEVTDNNFWQAVGLMRSAEETLKAEIAAGHYTLNHMGFFWLQGCSDSTKTAGYYADSFTAMFEGFREEMAFDHDGSSDTADKTLEFAGIILVRRGGDGINNLETDYYMVGSRTAQYTLGNTADNNIYLVGNVGDYWRTDGDVASYFVNKYGTNDSFKAITNATYNMPTTVNEVHPDIHYRQVGYNEIARDAVHNLLRQKGIIEAEAAEITFKLLDQYGVVCDFASKGVTLASGASVKIVPDAAPRYLAGTVSVTTSANITHDGYYTFTSTDGAAGTITFTCSGTSVTVNVNR